MQQDQNARIYIIQVQSKNSSKITENKTKMKAQNQRGFRVTRRRITNLTCNKLNDKTIFIDEGHNLDKEKKKKMMKPSSSAV